MKKKVGVVYIIGIVFIANVFCMILGPISWVNSAIHFAELSDFQKIGTKATGTISSMDKRFVFRSSIYYVKVEIKNLQDEVMTKEITVSRIIWMDLNLNDIVEVYYKIEDDRIDDLILVESFNTSKLALINHPLYGKLMTIISYSLFVLGVLFIFRIRARNKPREYIRPEK